MSSSIDERGAGPFQALAHDIQPQSELRTAITRHYRAPEPDCVAALVQAAALSPNTVEAARLTAHAMVETLRAKGTRGAVEGLVREYDLSSQEGVALMCLAEALLRIPDRATRDSLIRDKIGGGDWRGHIGQSPSLFVNAATLGLVITGKLTGTANEAGLGAALTRLIARGGEPVIRLGVDMAMRMMGEQFVTGQTIAEALTNAKRLEARAISLLLRHARRGGDHRGRCRPLLRGLRGRDPCDRPGVRWQGDLRGAGNLHQTVSIASPLFAPAA